MAVESHEPDAVRDTVLPRSPQLDGQRCLADAAWTGQGDEPVRFEQRDQVLEGPLAPEEARHAFGQVAA